MARFTASAAWCGVAALALAGCAGNDGRKDAPVTDAPVAGSFEIRAVTAEASVLELPAGAECAQTPLAPNQSGWVCEDANSTGYLVGPASLTAADVASVVTGQNAILPGTSKWEVYVTFTAAGATKFEALTGEVARATPPANKIAMLVNGEVLSAPYVMEAITGGGAGIVLTGGEAEAKAVAAAITGTGGSQE